MPVISADRFPVRIPQSFITLILDRIKESIVETEKEQTEKQKRLPLLYERYVDGKITRDHFAEEKESIGKAIAELNNLEREYQTLHDEPNQMLFDEDEKQVLSNKLIARYIDKITVFGRNEFEISWL